MPRTTTLAILLSILSACDTRPAEVPDAIADAEPIDGRVARDTTSQFPGGGCYHPTHRPGGMPLQDIVDSIGPIATLTVDQSCWIDNTLVLPHRFTLRGEKWSGNGSIEIAAPVGIRFSPGTSNDSNSTIEDLDLVGVVSGATGISIEGRHKIRLRDLHVHHLQTGVYGEVAFSVDIDDCIFHNNDVSIQAGLEANTWRIRGGICSQSGTCIRLHENYDGNDALVSGVRMESNDTAIEIGGHSVYVAFNRFEGNTEDVVQLPTAHGVAMVANNIGGLHSDLSGITEGVTGLPDIDHELNLSILEGTNPAAQLHTDYIPGTNVLRTQLMANNQTVDGSTVEAAYSTLYGGWTVQMDGGAATASSGMTVHYRDPDLGTYDEIVRIEPDGDVLATDFVQLSDARLKENIAPVDGALEKLLALRGVEYDWTSEGQGHAMGVLAQEVGQVFPSAVSVHDSGTQAVRYNQLTAPIIEAIRELAAQNEQLARDNQALRRSVDELRAGVRAR